jgi:hypothetical protein
MMLKSQQRSQRKPYVIALRSALSRLATFYSAKLLNASVVLLDHLTHLRIFQPLKLSHLQLVRCPVFNAAVFGDYLEYSNQAIRLEVNHAARLAYLHSTQSPVPAAVRVNEAIAFQLRKPIPAEATDSFQVLNTGLPAIKQHTLRRKSSLGSLYQHLAEVVVVCRAVRRLVKQAVVARYISLAVSSQQSDKIYTRNDTSMLARPVAADEFNLSGIRQYTRPEQAIVNLR